MTVLAPEAADAAAGAAGGRAAARGRRRRPPARSTPSVRTTSGGSTIVRGSGGSKVSTSREGQRAMQRNQPKPSKPPKFQSFTTGQARRATPTTRISRTNYQPIILAEFVAAVLLVAATPVATGKNKPGLSPYAGQDMIKLAAITVLYLILALLSTGGRGPGRVGAWFGGLILLTVGLAEGANLAKVFDLFGGGTTSDTDSGEGAGGPKK